MEGQSAGELEGQSEGQEDEEEEEGVDEREIQEQERRHGSISSRGGQSRSWRLGGESVGSAPCLRCTLVRCWERPSAFSVGMAGGALGIAVVERQT